MWRGMGRRRAGAEFPAGTSNQISLMKWTYDTKTDGAEATGILPCAS